MIEFIRQATKDDVSRLAEILIFSKRLNYRSIFCNDRISFSEMQVVPLATELMKNEALLNSYWVYVDEFVKGLIRIDGLQIVELYVDTFFVNHGIGQALLDFAIQIKHTTYLWVLEKNERAISFYSKNGFRITNERAYEDGAYIIKMTR